MRRRRTDFGFEEVPVEEKAARVGAVFDSVAGRYDLMNDLMSLGVHRLWKRFAALLVGARPGGRVLDLAGGTGDLARLLARRVGPEGRVVLADINRAMIEAGRDRLIDAGLAANVTFVRADAERLPFRPGSFDSVVIGFGLRNVTDRARAIAAMREVLRPGGDLSILEFSRLELPWLRPLYDAYSLRLLPWLGQRVTGSAGAYRYLAESIRRFPDQEELRAMMMEAGFERCTYHNLSAGIVALHRGYRL